MENNQYNEEQPESGKLYYVAVAVDKDNNVLIQSGKVTVNTVDITGGAKGSISTTPKIDGSEDYKSLVNQSVNIGEVFEVQTNDDYVRDNNETFTVKITDVVDTNYESPSIDTAKNTVTSTITDNPAKNIITTVILEITNLFLRSAIWGFKSSNII